MLTINQEDLTVRMMPMGNPLKQKNDAAQGKNWVASFFMKICNSLNSIAPHPDPPHYPNPE